MIEGAARETPVKATIANMEDVEMNILAFDWLVLRMCLRASRDDE